MASVCRGSSVLHLSRLSAVLQALGRRKDWRSANFQPLYRLASSASSRESTESVSVSTRNRLSKDKDLRQVSAAHAGTNEQASSDGVAQEEGGSEKKRKSWKPASKKDKEDVITTVLPGRGEAKAIKFRLGKKFVTVESARGKTLTNEDLEDGAEGASGIIELYKLPKSTDGHQMEETSELFEALESKLSLTRKDQSLYSNALPSVFGTTVGGAKQVAMALNKAGLTKSDVSVVLPKFPHILDVDYVNVARVYKMLNAEYRMNKRWLMGLLKNHPHIFTLEEEVVRERMDVLLELGLYRREIASLLNQHPLLIMCPLSAETLEVARQAKKAGLSSRWLAKSLSYNLHLRPARIEMREDLKKLVELLKNYSMDTADVLISQPSVLTLQAEDVSTVIHVLTGHPLYLNSPDISYLLTKQPDLFRVTDLGNLRTHLSLLSEVMGSTENVRYMFRSVPNLLHPSCDIQSKLELLTSKGFSKENACDLISQCPSLLTRDTATEFKPKLELLMGVPGVVPTHLTKSPRSYFLLDIKSLQARYNFAKEHKVKLLKASKLNDIFCSTDKEFATFCGVELSDYYEWTGFTPLIRRRQKYITTDSNDGTRISTTLGELRNTRITRLPFKVAQVSAKDTTELTDIHTEYATEDETGVSSGVVSLESELGLEKEAVTEESLGMELGLSSQDSLSDLTVSTLPSEIDDSMNIGKDFDNLVQYDSTLPSSEIDKTTLKQSVLPPQRYHQDHHSLLSGGAVMVPASLAGSSLEATQMSRNVPRTSAKYLIDEAPSKKKLANRFSAIVGAEQASCNNDNLSYMPSEASQVSLSDSTCSSGGGESLLEGMECAAVQLDIHGDNETTTDDSGDTGHIEVGAVDLDSFVSKEASDLLQELRKEAILKESSHLAFVKGVARIGEIDGLIEDGLQLDFVEELLEVDQNSHHFTSSM